ncbi:MAG: mercury transporter [Henriciella sp.]|nr:mercury transporter [Henriciella sp.]
MKRTWILTGLAALVIDGGWAYAGPQKAGTPAAEAVEASTRFTIDNMTCATCPIAVRNAMMRVEGVKSVDIDYAARTAEVVYDPSETTPEAIAAASTNVGYPASVASP